MPRRQRPALCAGCMEIIRIAAHELKSVDAAIDLAHGNALLRADGEELVTLDEKRQCMAEDADEMAELRRLLEAARATVEEFRVEKAKKKIETK